MNRTILAAPPNPDTPPYSSNPASWQTAMYQWALDVKKRVETDSAANVRPVSPFVVSTYTAVNTMTGTDALSNFVATFITAMQAKGITATRDAT